MPLGEDGKPAPSPRDLARASTLPVRELQVAFDDVPVADPATTAIAQGHLRVTVKDPDPKKVGKPFTTAIVESALGSYPGMFPTSPPGEGTPFGVYWPTLVDRASVPVSVTVDGEQVAWSDPWTEPGIRFPSEDLLPQDRKQVAGTEADPRRSGSPSQGRAWADRGRRGPATRAATPTSGVWVPAPGEGASAGLDEAAVQARYAWLESYVTAERVRELLPEAAGLAVDVHPLPNLRAVNVVIHGLLDVVVCGQLRSREITQGEADSAEPELAGHADRQRLSDFVQHVRFDSRQWRADVRQAVPSRRRPARASR